MSTSTGKPAADPSLAPTDEAYAAWRAAVAAVLAKGRGVGPAELGAEPERRLDATTYDGITLAALYTARDELPEAAPPGSWPYTRGRTTAPGWLVCERIAGGDPDRTRKNVRDALAAGATAVWLDEPATAMVGEVLPALDPGRVPLVLSCGTDLDRAGSALAALSSGTGTLDACLGVDPCSALLHGAQVDLDAAAALGARVSGSVTALRTFVVDGTVLHEAGASDADELGAAIAAALMLVRGLTAAGLEPAAALAQLDFRLAATDDQFQTIAKLRAARLLWARVGEVLGAPAAAGMRQHAVTSLAMTSARDPYVNLLRTTVAAFGAGVGGADLVTVRPFDAAIADGLPGTTPDFASRMARNIQLLLLEESHLGRVRDPAAGSWYVESLTEQLAERAWECLQQLEAAGGYADAVASGALEGRIAATRADRDADVAHRRRKLTGLNEFPDLTENPLPPGPPAADGPYAPRRYGHAFEALRARSDAFLTAHGRRPTVFLATLGPVADHTARAGFTANLLASAGIVTIDPGAVADDDALVVAMRAADTRTAVVCGTDAAYGERGTATLAALRDAGAQRVLVAGRPGALPGADGYLAAGDDAVAALRDLLANLGVP